MQIQKIQNNNYNTNFGAGMIKLKNIELKDLLQFDTIKRIAEEDSLDLFISKGKESKYLPRNNNYNVVAKRDIDKFPYSAYGFSCMLTSKTAQSEEVSAKLLELVKTSVDKLAENIKKHTGTKPEFMKYLEEGK
jgi:hypothetical protein